MTKTSKTRYNVMHKRMRQKIAIFLDGKALSPISLVEAARKLSDDELSPNTIAMLEEEGELSTLGKIFTKLASQRRYDEDDEGADRLEDIEKEGRVSDDNFTRDAWENDRQAIGNMGATQAEEQETDSKFFKKRRNMKNVPVDLTSEQKINDAFIMRQNSRDEDGENLANIADELAEKESLHYLDSAFYTEKVESENYAANQLQNFLNKKGKNVKENKDGNQKIARNKKVVEKISDTNFHETKVQRPSKNKNKLPNIKEILEKKEHSKNKSSDLNTNNAITASEEAKKKDNGILELTKAELHFRDSKSDEFNLFRNLVVKKNSFKNVFKDKNAEDESVIARSSIDENTQAQVLKIQSSNAVKGDKLFEEGSTEVESKITRAHIPEPRAKNQEDERLRPSQSLNFNGLDNSKQSNQDAKPVSITNFFLNQSIPQEDSEKLRKQQTRGRQRNEHQTIPKGHIQDVHPPKAKNHSDVKNKQTPQRIHINPKVYLHKDRERKLKPVSMARKKQKITTHPSLFHQTQILCLSVLLLCLGVYLSLKTDPKAIIALATGGITLAFILIEHYFTSYHISKNRIEHKYGIINRSSKEVRIQDITSINVNAHKWLGFIGIGDLEIFTAGDKPEVIMQDLWRARKYKKIIRKQQDRN